MNNSLTGCGQPHFKFRVRIVDVNDKTKVYLKEKLIDVGDVKLQNCGGWLQDITLDKNCKFFNLRICSHLYMVLDAESLEVVH
jgi:hypothetical protein